MRNDLEVVDGRAENPPPDPDNLIPSQQARRRRIVQAALHLLEERPYEKIQMRDVADEASVALGTVYRYFASKEHLFAAVLVDWSGQLGDRVKRRPLRGSNPKERLSDMMNRVLSSFERWPQFFGVVMQLQTTSDIYAQMVYAEFAKRTTGTFREALEGLHPDDVTAVTEVINAVLDEVGRFWTLGQLSMTGARERMQRAIDLVLGPPPRMVHAPD
ncbi:MAG: TetR family transcriptional regulator [Acidimicrobiales bacterium]|nr:TetR family transcriptional regulator [Acidimicrobiales bacterium]